MASAHNSDEESTSESESDISDKSDSDEPSDVEVESQTNRKEPCKYYNSGGCRDGGRCKYSHVCKYALENKCKYGANCKLNHPGGGRPSSGGSSRASHPPTSGDLKLTDGRFFQWQLNDGKGWKDVSNDHVIEAQYALPHTKSIKIYNSPYGAVSIDFNRMRVYGKSLRVRRLDDGKTMWAWYCTLRRKWIKYGDKDSKGNQSPVKNADIERKFQSNPTGSFTFSIGGDSLEIKFRDMQQVGNKKKRKVTRRPLYRQQSGASQAQSVFQNLSMGSKPQWEFEGKTGWHVFKHRKGTSSECSINSEDIEKKYKQNPRDTMMFKVGRDPYKLDLGAMTQTNLTTKRTCNVRRVLV
ncbi:protein mono-ADP-ribosyltransferase PARP12 [Enoplosus armatus]|uniref:protein mono-ADP-ribosyltransferase PARP12 n=1 Tax=Enoplosus armatus TaxID=215367 RepID=UPI003994DEBF